MFKPVVIVSLMCSSYHFNLFLNEYLRNTLFPLSVDLEIEIKKLVNNKRVFLVEAPLQEIQRRIRI